MRFCIFSPHVIYHRYRETGRQQCTRQLDNGYRVVFVSRCLDSLLSCGVFLVKSSHFGLPLALTIRPNWQSLSAGGSVAIQTWSIYKVYTWRDEDNYCSKSERVITRLYLWHLSFQYKSCASWEYPTSTIIIITQQILYWRIIIHNT